MFAISEELLNAIYQLLINASHPGVSHSRVSSVIEMMKTLEKVEAPKEENGEESSD